MLVTLRESRAVKVIVIFLLLTLFNQFVTPQYLFALTGGPSQPEVQSFEPIGTSEMVDLLTGDFVYNIPLLDVGGYPLNIAYHAGISMDQEASWVGLGWNINPGAITRNMRGIPDDFSQSDQSDQITVEHNIKTNWTFRLGANVDAELFGIELSKLIGMNFGCGLLYNNYKGLGYDYSFGLNIGCLDIGLGYGTQTGQDVSAGISLEKVLNSNSENKTSVTMKGSVSLGYNSRQGLKDLTFAISVQPPASSNTYLAAAMGKFSSASSTISFANSTYVPNITPGMASYAFSVDVKIGLALYGLDGFLGLSASYNQQNIREKTNSYPAFGYLHSELAAYEERAMMDFNREKDGGFSEFTRNLPVTNFTYDLYSVTGQGSGGMFRPYRGNIGSVYDPKVTLGQSGEYALGGIMASIELGVGSNVKLGGNIKVMIDKGHFGRWNDGNLFGKMIFSGKSTSVDEVYEPAFFKIIGEKAISDDNYFNLFNENQPVYGDINKYGVIDPTFRSYENRTKREKRKQCISSLTAKEADLFGLNRKIEDVALNGDGRYAKLEYLDRNDENRKSHHLSEITSTNPDGSRYVYGIPAYNMNQKEVAFAVDPSSVFNCQTGLVKYSPSNDNTFGDNTSDNEKGYDNYFNSTSLPPYAHSYLLTSVLSPDYIDINGNGPDSVDYGSYTQFHYTRLHTNYNWRVPYQKDSANHILGLRSETDDDKGTYIWGEKEIWILSSIETKTYIAEFVVSDREDGLDVTDENGGRGTHKLKKLDKIVLYSRMDRILNGPNAVPIKTVLFEYSYELCKNVPNNTGQNVTINNVNINANKGKLTLKKIWFKYQNNEKGRLSPYVFEYNSNNPSYNMKNYDRWGNYKPNTCAESQSNNSDFPYVDQTASATDLNNFASSWCMTDITLPSGGKMHVAYESDDYAYVQNRQAMQMIKVTSAWCTKDYAARSTHLYGVNDNTYLFFKLDQPLYSDEAVTKKYVPDNKVLYYNFLTNITESNFEYISGYAQIIESGVALNSQNEYGYIKINQVPIDDGDDDKANPISKTAWQFARLNLPYLVNKASDMRKNGYNFTSMIDFLFGSFNEIATMITGYNTMLRYKEFAKDFDPDKSWIRLLTPEKKKKGGGIRVKKIEFSDEWNVMTNTPNNPERKAVYGQEYNYEMVETQSDNSSKTISSGVASYEPLIGGDENPFRLPIAYKEDVDWVPDNVFYLEEPMGESFFPAPTVCYRKVSVKNLAHSNITRHATGRTDYEFYTTYDFPTVATQTQIKVATEYPEILFRIFGIKSDKFTTASQGYAIELNDMNGKPKSQVVYNEAGIEVKGVEYLYKVDNPSSLSKHLNNQVKVLNKDGTFNEALMGVDIDMVGDFREKEEKKYSIDVPINLDAFLASIIPIIIPVVLSSYSCQHDLVRSCVITKVINRYGILEKTIAHDEEARIETQNLAFDPETGDVLLTKTQNEHADEIYNLTIPAHWAYDRMGPAYLNQGLSIKSVPFKNGITSDNTNTSVIFASNNLVPGDEIAVQYTNPINHNMYYDRFWVLDVDKDNKRVSIVNRNGGPPTFDVDYNLTVIRSGRRNQQSLPVGNISLLNQNPLDNGSFTAYGNNKVLNASALEYSDKWQNFVVPSANCSCTLTQYGTHFQSLLNALIAGNYFGSTDPVQLADKPFFTSGALYNYFNQPSSFYFQQKKYDANQNLNIGDDILDVLIDDNNNTYLITQGTNVITILKIDAGGLLIDTKDYKLNSQTDSYKIKTVKLIDNNLVLVGSHTNSSGIKRAYLMIINPANLNLVTSKDIYVNSNNTNTVSEAFDVCSASSVPVTPGCGGIAIIGSYLDGSDNLMFLVISDLTGVISTIGKKYNDQFYTQKKYIGIRNKRSLPQLEIVFDNEYGIANLTTQCNGDGLSSSPRYLIMYNINDSYDCTVKYSPLSTSTFDVNSNGDVLVAASADDRFYLLSSQNIQYFRPNPSILQNAIVDKMVFDQYDHIWLSGSAKEGNDIYRTYLFNSSNSTKPFKTIESSRNMKFALGSNNKISFANQFLFDNQLQNPTTNFVSTKTNDINVCETYDWYVQTDNSPKINCTKDIAIDPINMTSSPVIINTTPQSPSIKGQLCSTELTFGNDNCKISLSLETSGYHNIDFANIDHFSNLRKYDNQLDCPEADHQFSITATTTNNEILTFSGYACFPIDSCKLCGYSPGVVCNPYITGMRGNWHPKRSYVYYDKSDANSARSQSGNSNYNLTDTRNDGTIKNFQPFWKPNTTVTGGDWEKPSNLNVTLQPWSWKAEVTKYNPFGFEIENADPLGIYSSVLYGYENTLPIAIAHNAKYRQIAYDGFEDYRDYPTCPPEDHWSFRKDLSGIASVTTNNAHSGLQSLKLNTGSVSVIRDIDKRAYISEPTSFISRYFIKPQDEVGIFSPSPLPNITEDYIVSYWEKADDFNNISITVNLKINNQYQSVSFSAVTTDVIVEGWKKVERKFSIPSDADQITVTLINTGNNPAYFDDIRIFPAKANMKTYVYDPISLKLLATLDENNYATFYEYDEEGLLVRIKKETERGIMTIQESRQNVHKNN